MARSSRASRVLTSTDEGATFTAPFPELEMTVVALLPVAEDSIYGITSNSYSGGIVHWGNY